MTLDVTATSTTDWLYSDGRLSTRAYNDDAVFQRELTTIFRRGWVYVAHESQVAQPGDYVTTRVGSEPVIVSRDEDNRIHVLRNRCLHKGAIVCAEAYGNANYFRCPYHAWTYHNDGRVAGVFMPAGYGQHLSGLKSSSLAAAAEVAVHAGFIFARMEGGGRGLIDHLGAAASYLERYADSAQEQAIQIDPRPYRYKYRGNWKLQIENTIENYHAFPLHEGFFRLMARRTGASEARSNPFLDEGPVTTVDLGNGHGGFLHNKGRNRTAQAVDAPPKGDSYFDRALLSPDGRSIVDSLRGELSDEELLALLEPTCDFNVGIFPNLQIVQGQLRVLFPVSVDYTEVEAYVGVPADAPQKVKDLRFRIVETFWGPAGHGSPDDAVMFERVQEGCQAAQPDRILIQRGMDREIDEAGVRVGRSSDEGANRSFYKEWSAWITGAADGSVEATVSEL